MRSESYLAPFERLLEPAARAARRGDAEQVKAVLSKLRAAHKKFMRERPPESSVETVRGIVLALEGILGIVFAGAAADCRYETLQRFPYALQIMALIAKKARQGLLSAAKQPAAMSSKELAGLTGLEIARLTPILEALTTARIITCTADAAEAYFEITSEGAHLLEAEWPGWQVSRTSTPTAPELRLV